MDRPDFDAAIRSLPLRNRRTSKPSGNRASEIGAPVDCLRRLVYCRTHWDQRRQPDDTLMGIFATGNEVERIVIRNLVEASGSSDWQLIETQKTLEWPQYQIIGHCDGLLAQDHNAGSPGVFAGLEIKSVGQRFDSLKDIVSLMSWPISAKWYGQAQIYMLLSNLSLWALILVQKNNLYNTRTLWLELDYDYAESILQRAADINRHVAAGTLPDKTDNLRLCMKCDFSHVCMPDITATGNVAVIADDDIAAALTRMNELAAAHAEYKACARQVDSVRTMMLPDASEETYQQVQILQAGEHLLTYVGAKRTTKPTEGGTSYFWRRSETE